MSGPRVKKKRGEKEKRENSKKITGKNGKKNIKKRKEAREEKKDNSARVHVFLALVRFCSFVKKSTKTKGITDTDLAQEKAQDQSCWFFFPLVQENVCAFFLSLQSNLSACSLLYFWKVVNGGTV